MTLAARLPWQAKIAAKLVLARLPFAYRYWQRLNLFRHGAMHEADYALGVFARHYQRAAFGCKDGGFTVLELGPGDSLFSGLIAHAHGAARSYLVDSGPYATTDPAPYRRLLARLHSPLDQHATLPDWLAASHTVYLTEGLASLRTIPDESVDFIWSQAVLEHVRRHEFAATLTECRRILKPDGVASHCIDLKDHLGGGLNNLRFSERLWEADFMVRSGFYTNRLRYSELLDLFAEAGFAVELLSVNRWPAPPLPLHKLAAEFRRFSADDLCVREFDVLLTPA